MSIIFIMLVLFSVMLMSFSIIYYHRIWNPILLFLMMFLLGAILARKNSDPRVFESATLWILIGEIFFCITFFLAQTCFNRRTLYDYTINVSYNWRFVERMLDVNIMVGLCGLLLGIYEVMKVAPSFMDIFTNSTAVRYAYLQRSSGGLITLLGILLSLNFFVTFCFFPLALQNKVKGSLSRLVIVLCIRLFGSLITMSKQAFLIDVVFFISAYMLIIKNKKEEYKFYIKYGSVILLLVMALLVVISFQRNYIGSGRYSGYGKAIIGTLREYISVTIEAFGKLVNLDTIIFTEGNLCFRPIINILSYLGIGKHVSIFQSAVTDIVDVNVYTAFGNMYRDFSFGGIVILSTLLGIVLGSVYNTNYKYRFSNIVINSLITMTLFFAYFDLKIIQTIYIFVMLYAKIFELVLKNKIYVVIEE